MGFYNLDLEKMHYISIRITGGLGSRGPALHELCIAS